MASLQTYLMVDIWRIIYGKLIQSYDFNTIHALKHTCRDVFQAFSTMCTSADQLYRIQEEESVSTSYNREGVTRTISTHNIFYDHGETRLAAVDCIYDTDTDTDTRLDRILIFINLAPTYLYMIRLIHGDTGSVTTQSTAHAGVDAVFSKNVNIIARIRATLPRYARIIEYMWGLIIQHRYVQEFAAAVIDKNNQSYTTS